MDLNFLDSIHCIFPRTFWILLRLFRQGRAHREILSGEAESSPRLCPPATCTHSQLRGPGWRQDPSWSSRCTYAQRAQSAPRSPCNLWELLSLLSPQGTLSEGRRPIYSSASRFLLLNLLNTVKLSEYRETNSTGHGGCPSDLCVDMGDRHGSHFLVPSGSSEGSMPCLCLGL